MDGAEPFFHRATLSDPKQHLAGFKTDRAFEKETVNLHLTKNGSGTSITLHFLAYEITIMTSQLLDAAAKIITSPQILINVVSKRVRQLSQGHRPLVEVGPRMGLADIAFTEIIEGKLTWEEAPFEAAPSL